MLYISLKEKISMISSLKLTTIGNSVGVVLPKEILTKLRVDKGDTLYVVETPEGIELTSYCPEFRDSGLLESALAKPKNTFFYAKGKFSIPDLAAAYAYAIAKNHPFLDGNKRVAFVVSMLFMTLNGWKVAASQEMLYATFRDLAAGKISEEQLVPWFNSVSQKV